MKALVLGLVGAVALASSGAVGAQVVYDANPQVGFVYGAGNDYLPANAAVLNTGSRTGGEISGRAHVPTQPAASTGGTGIYTFNLGQNVSFDFSFFGSDAIANALVTITNVADGADASFAAALLGTVQSNGALQGSQQLGFGFLNGSIDPNQDINFSNAVNGTYRIDLSGGGVTNTFFAQVGTGAVAAVPEPATWAMMLIGFGAIGVSLRRRRRANGLLQAA